jgi:hypothetical protein
VPTVPFPSPSAKARLAPRVPTDPIERASTEAFAESETQDRHEDSAMALLRGVGDATGVIEAPPDFDSKTAESGLLAGRAGPSDDPDAGAASRANPTDLDLPLVKPPPEDEAARAETADADDEPGAARAETADHRAETIAPAAQPKAKPDRLARGLRAFGFKPTERDGDGKFRSTGNLKAAEPAGASERPLTSPLIPPPAPATAAPTPAASATTTAVPTLAAVAAAAAAPAAPAIAAPTAHDAAAEPTKVPISTAPSSLPPPSEKQSATSGPSPACPQCEAPMAWVEAHLRFYCKSCKMYF